MVVSFILPAYNAESVLQSSVQSVLDQVDSDWELIIVNDGSMDNTGLVADSFAMRDSRVKTVHQVNAGVSAARNAGIAHASGQYLAFLDADDMVSPAFVSSIKSCIVNGSPDLIEIPYDWNMGERVFVPEDYCGPSERFLIKKLGMHSAFACWQFVFSKELVASEGISFTAGRRTGEDQEFSFMALLRAKDCATIADASPLYHYWLDNTDSASHSHSDGQFDYPAAMKAVFDSLSSATNLLNRQEIRQLVACRVVEATRWASNCAFANGMATEDIISKCDLVLTEEICSSVLKSALGLQDTLFFALVTHFKFFAPLYFMLFKVKLLNQQRMIGE